LPGLFFLTLISNVLEAGIPWWYNIRTKGVKGNNVKLNSLRAMKKLLLSIGLLVGGVAFVNAQDTTSVQPQPQMQEQSATSQDQQREQIQVSDLPDPVKRAIESQDYQGWTVSAAYRSSMSETDTQGDASKAGQELYILDLRNGAETKTVKFDKDGNKLDKEKSDDDQKK
jgi:hypothetical protein